MDALFPPRYIRVRNNSKLKCEPRRFAGDEQAIESFMRMSFHNNTCGGALGQVHVTAISVGLVHATHITRQRTL